MDESKKLNIQESQPRQELTKEEEAKILAMILRDYPDTDPKQLCRKVGWSLWRYHSRLNLAKKLGYIE